jgi:hypothetical protein
MMFIIHLKYNRKFLAAIMLPSKVQQEIFSRYYARKEQIKQQDASNERRRMLGWISVYHEQAGDQNNSEDEPDFY